MDGTPSLAAVLLELTDTLTPEFDTAGMLFHLAVVSVELLDIDAAGVLLLDEHGRLVEVAATHDSTNGLERLQAETDHGPCLESARLGRPVWCADLDEERHRWPDFVRQARDEGFRALHAQPLGLHGEIVGGLNLFRRHTGVLDTADQEIAHLLSTAAATGLLHRRAVHQRDTLNEQLEHALASRIIIEQAKGFLAARLGSSPERAFALLRALARSRRERLTDAARAVVEGRAATG
jgi:transcriptional regulator with GAF, ATPase, and Fis domain